MRRLLWWAFAGLCWTVVVVLWPVAVVWDLAASVLERRRGLERASEAQARATADATANRLFAWLDEEKAEK